MTCPYPRVPGFADVNARSEANPARTHLHTRGVDSRSRSGTVCIFLVGRAEDPDHLVPVTKGARVPGIPRRLLVAVATALMLAAASGSATPASATAASCDGLDKPITRLINRDSGAMLLTQSSSEIANAPKYGFGNDSVLADVATAPGPGLIPIWRLWKAGDFVFVAQNHLAPFLDTGYLKQFVQFYAATEISTCAVPINLMTRNGIHRLAADGESNDLAASGWTRGPIAFYANSTTPDLAPDGGAQGDTKFAIAVLPDTQNEVVNASDPRFKNRAEWLSAHKKELDIRYAMQVGDLVNWGAVAPNQFSKASTDIAPLEASMPWAGAIGNHDTAAVCTGGSACPGVNTNISVRDTTAYNRAFPTSRFKQLGGIYEPGKIDNAFHTFSAGGVDWLVLNLELWPRPGAVNWARTVVSSHPDRNVVVLTHSYLDDNGSISASNGGYGETSPQYLYDNLIRVYPNIKLVLSGHVGNSAVRTDVGVSGNKILSLLQTFHSSTNPVRIVQIDTAAGTVTSSVYAPGTDTKYPSYVTSTSGLQFH